jgi:hypothetical protein
VNARARCLADNQDACALGGLEHGSWTQRKMRCANAARAHRREQAVERAVTVSTFFRTTQVSARLRSNTAVQLR